MSTYVSQLPDAHPTLEKSLSRFWREADISFPWAFHLHLYCHDHGGNNLSEPRRTWMRERHGEAAESLRAATRMALAAVGR